MSLNTPQNIFSNDGLTESASLETLSSENIASVALTQNAFNNARQAFANRYFLANGSTAFTSQFGVLWNAFNAAVNDIITSLGVSQDQVLLSFYHRYDTRTNNWFLTMGGVIRSENPVGEIDGNLVYDMTPGTLRFDLKSDSVTPSLFTADADREYFDNFYYRNDMGEYIPLSSDLYHTQFVTCVQFPWEAEVKQLLTDNHADPNLQKVGIVFSSCSFDYPQPSEYANIQWPHTICLCLQIDSNICLDNTEYTGEKFRMKAEDFANLCPPSCNKFVLSSDL